jgi:Ca-activated chloride channel family protein
MIHFAQPFFFNGIFVVVAIAALIFFLAKVRRKVTHQFGEKKLTAVTARSFSFQRFMWKEILIVGVFLFSVIALTRPQWGFDWQEVRRRGLDILVLIDTSKSMLTEDVKPNRLERAKLAVKDLLKKLKGDRIGIIAFAGDAFLTCPLTADYSGFVLSLDDLAADVIPRGGTDLAKAIQESLKGYEDVSAQYKAVIVLTDGENWEGDPVQWARVAAQKKIRIYTVGIGTREGELIHMVKEDGEAGFVKDASGNFVKSRLNEGMLKEIAAVTGGAYVRSSGVELGLDYIYDNYLSRLEKRDIESKMEQRYYERFQIPLFLALLLLVFEARLSLRRPKE